jgi:hypothetical protein
MTDTHKGVIKHGWWNYDVRKKFLLLVAFTAVQLFVVCFSDQRILIAKNARARVCVCVCARDCLQTAYHYRFYQIILTLKCFYTSGAVRIFDRIFIIGAQAMWLWLGQYVTLDRTFYIPCSKQLIQVSRWDMNQWASPSQYKGYLCCLCSDNWTVSTGCSFSKSVFVFSRANEYIDTDIDILFAFHISTCKDKWVGYRTC